MTVSASDAYSGPYTANGSVTVFPFGFPCQQASDVSVQIDYVDITTGFTVSLNADQSATPGGAVTFATAPASGEVIVYSDPDLSQEAAFAIGVPWNTQAVTTGNGALDRLAIQHHALRRDVSRSPLVNIGSVPPSIPDKSAMVGKFWAGDIDGNVIPASGTGADAALRADLATNGGGLIAMANGRSAQDEMSSRAIRIATLAGAAALNLAALYGTSARIIIAERGLVEWVRVTAATAASGQNKWWFTDAGGIKWMIAYTGRLNPLNCGAAGGCIYNFATNVATGPDDSAYVQAALDYFQTMGWPGTVEFTDLHNIASVQAMGPIGAPTLYAGLNWYGDNIRLQRVGYGRVGCVFSAAAATPNYRGLHASGGGKVSTDVTTNRGCDKVGYTPTGPIAANATTIPLPAGTGANFAANDVLLIRTGQCINPPNGTVNEPDGELNVVQSVAGDVVTLKYPTITGYQQEYFITGNTGQTNTTNVGGTAARFELANVSDRIMQGGYIDIDLIGHNCLQVLNLWGVMHFEIAATCRIVHGYNGLGSRESRWVYDGARHTHTGRVLGYFKAPSTCCSDWTVDWWGVSPTSYAYFHLHEGVKRLHMRSCYGVCAGSGSAVNGMIDILARCYQIRCDQAYLDSGTAPQSVIVVGAVSDVQDNYSDGGVSFGLVTHRNANSAGSAILINGANVSFDAEPIALGIADRISNVTYTRNPTWGVRIGSMFFGPMLFDRQLILGQVGQDAQVVEFEERIDVAFATGDRRFRAGYSGAMTAYVNAQVVNTLAVGDMTVTRRGSTTINGAAGTSYAGPSIGAPQSGTRQIVCEIDQTSGTTNYTAGAMRVAAIVRRMARTS